MKPPYLSRSQVLLFAVSYLFKPYKFAVADGGHAGTIDTPALKGSGLAHGLEVFRLNDVALPQIPNGEICSHGNMEALSRIGDQQLEQVFERNDIFFDQIGMTSMMGHRMEIESAVTTALNKCATLEILDSTLYAKDMQGNIVLAMEKSKQ